MKGVVPKDGNYIRVIPRDGSFAYPDDYEDPDHQHDYSLQRVEPKKPNLNELYK